MVAKKVLLAAIGCITLSAASFAATAPGDTTTPASTQKSQHPISDSKITAKVKTALLAKDDLKSLHIHVETKNGVVTLTGTVPSKDQADTAEDVAKGIEGVAEVKNSLTTKTASK